MRQGRLSAPSGDAKGYLVRLDMTQRARGKPKLQVVMAVAIEVVKVCMRAQD